MKNTYDSVLKEIQMKSIEIGNESPGDFYETVVNDLFVEKLQYKSEHLLRDKNDGSLWTDDLLIKSSVEQNWKKEISLLSTRLDKEKREWGILIHPSGMWLLNSKIETNTSSDFANQKKVLEIIYGLNIDQKYFEYFSAENTIGFKKNARFFSDIITYKNINYRGSEKSWRAYHSSLKRFLAFVAQDKGNYKEKADIYNQIEFAFFQEFLRKTTKSKSLSSAKNAFFHIKDFMHVMSDRGEFEKSAEEIEKSFPELVSKHEMQNIMDADKLKIALDFLGRKKNGVRNKAILLLFLSYGFERGKLCALEWNKNILYKERQLRMGRKIYPMPTYLVEILTGLEKETFSKKYVFCNSSNKALNEGTINMVLSGIAEANLEDVFYRQLTPVNIRRSLSKYLLKHGCPLEKILYLMDIEGGELHSYITSAEIENAFKANCRELNSSIDEHPMENFFEKS